ALRRAVSDQLDRLDASLNRGWGVRLDEAVMRGRTRCDEAGGGASGSTAGANGCPPKASVLTWPWAHALFGSDRRLNSGRPPWLPPMRERGTLHVHVWPTPRSISAS